MPSIANVNARVKARIEGSGLTLRVVYPAVRPVATGSSPGALPVRPLTGPAPTDGVFVAEPAGYQTAVTLKCLWLDALTGREATDVVHTEPRKAFPGGWVVGATSMARVLVEEAALDPTNPYAGTHLDSCEYVEFRGARFKVVQVTPVGASFGPPITYHVWLAGHRAS